MVERRNPEDAPAVESEAEDLEHDAHDHGEEDDPDDGKQRQLPVDGGDDRERRPQGECPRIAHEDLRRVDVEPEKAHERADHEGAEDREVRLRQLDAGHRHEADEQIGDEAEDEDTAGEPVQPIGEVDRIARPNDDEGDEADEEQRRDLELANERDVEARQVEVAPDVEGGEDRHACLPHQLPSPAHADAGAHVHEVVDRAEDPDAHERQHRRHRRRVLDPERHGQEEDDEDHEHPAHRRRPRLPVVRLGAVAPDLLPVAETLEEADVDRAEDDDTGEGEEQRDDDRDQAHGASSARSSTAWSRPMPREALRRTMSDGPGTSSRSTRATASAGSSVSATNAAPPLRAPSAIQRPRSPTVTTASDA